jgi:hypothetical protein
MSSPNIQTGSGAHPASYSVGTRGSFPGVKQPGHEIGHSPQSGTKVTSLKSKVNLPYK